MSLSAMLPPLPTVAEVQERLAVVFPESFPDRGILVGMMAARVVFVFLYGGFLEGGGRCLRPSFIYLFTHEQAGKVSEAERTEWALIAGRPGFRPPGTRWYADNSREPIRDDLLRNQFLRLGIAHRLAGVPTTASTPTWYLDAGFAALFDPTLGGASLLAAITAWQGRALDAGTLQRMALRAAGAQRHASDVLVEMPDGQRIRIAAGPSSLITQGLVEDFARIHLRNPVVLWLSASDEKAHPAYVSMAAQVGLRFDVNAELPDVILADLADPVQFLFCEVVATDGAVTHARKEALLAIVRASNVPEQHAVFVSAFEDRQSPALRKNFSALASDSLVWFRTEPNLLLTLATAKPSS